MKGVFYCLVLALQIVCWVSAARSRPLTSRDVHHTGTELSPWSSKGSLKSIEGFEVREDTKTTAREADYKEGVSKIGSSPPSCDHKCFGCNPCDAIQITTPSGNGHIRVQYANYEPIGWKCKCGPSFYSP